MAACGARPAAGDANHRFSEKHVGVKRAMTLQAMSFIFGAILLAVAILGGGFEVKEIKISNVTTSVRIFAGLVGVVFVGLGFWQPSALTGPIPVAATATMSEREHDKDRFGGDYSGFDIKTDHIDDCEGACKNDTKCLAWTYVKPAIQAPQARCYLKSVIPAISDNACCVSGTKIR
jgi:PAN domain